MIRFFFILFLAISFSFAENNNESLTVPQATTEAPSLTDSASLVAEIQFRDSLLAAKDSAALHNIELGKKELEIESARCENYEKSFNTVMNDYNTCSKILRISIENQEKQKQEINKKMRLLQITSFIGGILSGMLIYYLAID